jgi:hypothetical protein
MTRQIVVYKTNKQVLDFQDLLDPDPKRNKIGVTLLNYVEGKGATETVHAYLNADDARLLCHLIVNDQLPEEGWVDFKGSPREDGYEARVFRIKKLDPAQYKNPWSIHIERGKGQVMGQGAVKMIGKPEVSISILLPDWDMKAIALRILDYIRAWEITHWQQVAEDSARRAAG